MPRDGSGNIRQTPVDAYLVLYDGAVFPGRLVGAPGEAVGEVVFNTGMTGYQEILSDPSYAGQIVTFTYPMIGNYGMNDDDFESDRLQPAGMVVREACDSPSNWRSTKTLDQLLRERGMTGVQGIDTRLVTKRIRSGGVTMGMVTTQPQQALDRLRGTQGYGDRDFVYAVTASEPYSWGYDGKGGMGKPEESYDATIAVLDCGLKYNILRRFAALKVRSLVFPADVSVDEIMSHNPDGILLSPGPGDPVRLGPVVETVKGLLGRRPLFGICLGNQLLCQAVGGKTFKLKFGHRGSNHPVKDLEDGTVTITSQNHGYAVDPESLVGTDGQVTQLNLNDGTVEGIAVPSADAASIQYHPEAAPGPWDSRKHFVRFVERITQPSVRMLV